MKKKYSILFILIIFLVVIKLAVLFSFDDTYHAKDVYRGAIAKEIIEGPQLPLFEYPLDSYVGGSLVNGILAVPCFLLFGETAFSVKLVALLFQCAILVVLYLFLHRHLNWRVALLACLLFILSPKAVTGRSLTPISFHFQSILFTFLAMSVFFEIFFGNSEKQYLPFVLFGAISGFATYCGYGFLVTLLVCFLFWFSVDKIFFLKKRFLVFLVSFLIGFSPGIYFNVTQNFAGLRIRGYPVQSYFFESGPVYYLVRFKNMLCESFPDFLYANDNTFWITRPLSGLYYWLFGVAFCVLLWVNRQSIAHFLTALVSPRRIGAAKGSLSKETFFLVFPIVYIIIYGFSSFPLNFKYLIPTFPFVVIAIALFVDRMWNRNTSLRVVAILLTVILMSIGLGTNLSEIPKNKFMRGLRCKGYSHRILAINIGWKWTAYGDMEKFRRLIGGIKKQRKHYFYEGIGWGFGWTHKPPHWSFEPKIEEFAEVIETVDEKYRGYCYTGIGWSIDWLRESTSTNPIDIINRVDEKYRPYCYEGLIWQEGRISMDIRKESEFIEQLEEKYRPYCYRALGKRIGWYDFYQQEHISLLNELPPRNRNHCYEGLGWSIGERFEEDLPGAINWIEDGIAAEYRERCYRGLAEYWRKIWEKDISHFLPTTSS